PKALAVGPIADLVVVLKEIDERGRRQLRRALAARLAAIARRLALVGEALDRRAQELGGRVLIVLVVAALLAGQEHLQRVVPVVVPLRGISERSTVRVAAQVVRFILVVLE